MPASLTLKLIAKTAGFQKDLQMSQKAFGKFSKRVLLDSRAFQKIGRELKSFGTTLTIGLTAPIAAIGTSSVFAFANFEKGMNRVKALTGATGEDFKKLEQQAKLLGKTTQFSASQAAGGMGFLAQAGFDANKIIAAMPGVLQLAASAQLDLSSAADITTNVLTGFGLKTEELARVNDVLVTAMTNANTDLVQLGQAMKFAGPVASSAGVSFEETAAAIALMGNAGIQASLAGTSMRGAISRLLSPTGKAKDAIEDLGIKVFDTKGEFVPFVDIVRQLEKSGADTSQMMQIFGLRAGPAMSALVSQGADALEDFTKKLKDSGGTAEKIARVQMEGLKGQMIELKSAMEGAAIVIGEKIAPMLTKLIEKIKEATRWFVDLDEDTQKWIIGIAAGLAAAGPVIIGLGFFISSLQTIIPLIASVFWGPLGIIAAIATLSIFLVASVDDWDDVTESIKNNTSALITQIEKQGLLMSLSAAVLNALTLNIAGYQRWLEILAGVSAEGVASAMEINRGLAENTSAMKSMMGAMNKTFADASEKRKEQISELTQFQKDALEQAALDTKIAASKKLTAEISALKTQEDETRQTFRRIIGISRDANGEISGMRKVNTRQHAADKKDEKRVSKETADVKRLAAEGLAASLKLLWTDSQVTFEDAWQGALNTFVNVVTQMWIEADFATKKINITTASATAGISLVVGLIASVFTRKAGKKSQLQQATEDFLRNIKQTLKSFEEQVLTTLERIIGASERGRAAAERIRDAGKLITRTQAFLSDPKLAQRTDSVTRLMADLLEFGGIHFDEGTLGTLASVILENAKIAKDAIIEETKLKRESINEIFSLLRREKSFIKDIARSITDVERAFFSDEKLFGAQKNDIQKLLGQVSFAQGEEKLTLLDDLKAAYLASFETAKSLFEGDPEMLRARQAEVVKGLELVKESGKDAFDHLVDIQLEALKIDKNSFITEEKMEIHLRRLGEASIASLSLLAEIVKGDTSLATIKRLTDQINTIFPKDIFKLAHGGIVTKPTMALIAEAGQPEAVIPLSKLKSMMGGGSGGGSLTIVNQISIKDIGSLTVSRAEELLKGTFSKAAKNVARSGYRWPMQPEPT